jgi:hypothetical protein
MLPTPTPLPPVVATPAFTIDPADWSIWNATDEAIQIWNYDYRVGLVVQTFILVLLIVGFVWLMMYLIQNTMENG